MFCVKTLLTDFSSVDYRYLLQEKKRGKALDSVANFHLQNGAVCHLTQICRTLDSLYNLMDKVKQFLLNALIC